MRSLPGRFARGPWLQDLGDRLTPPGRGNAEHNVGLTERHRRFVDAQAASGRYASAGEVVREAPRRCENDSAADQSHLAVLRALAK